MVFLKKNSQARRKGIVTMTTMQMKLELILVPVTDVDRAKAFYTEKIGFHADFDQQPREDLRFVQLTPPGSACSIAIGKGITTMQPGSLEGLLMVVEDVRAVREELVKRGADISEIDVQDWGDFAYFSDPDGNRWSLQQLPKRNR
jgi:catechol 2,3-dioxygenase-like lactoylglutathione lyase family enzyme